MDMYVFISYSFFRKKNKSNEIYRDKKANKGTWWMPWLSQAKKDVISCDKLWGGANDL